MGSPEADVLAKPPFKKIDWLERDIDVERRADGVIVLRSRVPLNEYARHIPSFLRKWGAEAADRVWIAQRRGPQREWRKITYGEALKTVDAVTQALLNMGAGPEHPVAILSGNSLEHAMLTLAAQQARAPAAPVSPAYSLLSEDHEKLKYIFGLIRPKVIFVQDGAQFKRALDALNALDPFDRSGVHLIHVDNAPEGYQSTSWEQLAATQATPAVQQSVDAITPDTVGKLLFTSGSTGMPKAVINTQRMMCANTAMTQQCRKRMPGEPLPQLLDWMPWNHTMGGNALFNPLLADGGTMYIDDGRPVPGLFDETLRNFRDISPTYFANVPAGYAMLATALENDDSLAECFFRNLSLLAYGGATLPNDLYNRMQALAIRWTGHRIVFTTGWGSTETAPTATSTHWETERVGLIGLPHPGVELKMVPTGSKYELRLRGCIVTPGYHGRPDLTEAAFDEEGFYKIGDAGVFVNPDDPSEGLVFAGRVVEDFKLSSGTFVHVGTLRVAAIAATSPAIQDALVAGQDREFIGLLAWPNLPACRKLAGLPEGSIEEVIRSPKVVECVREGLVAHNAASTGSSMRIARAMLMVEPPSIDGHELTDKGYINQRASLERRAALVERLYAAEPGDDVIVIK